MSPTSKPDTPSREGGETHFRCIFLRLPGEEPIYRQHRMVNETLAGELKGVCMRVPFTASATGANGPKPLMRRFSCTVRGPVPIRGSSRMAAHRERRSRALP